VKAALYFVLHAPFHHLEVAVIPITAVRIAEAEAVVGRAAGEFDHPAAPVAVSDIGDGGPRRIVVVDVPANDGAVFAILVAPGSPIQPDAGAVVPELPRSDRKLEFQWEL
jgi:hypothetical protein